MENIRVAILGVYSQVYAFMDNEVPEALHFYSDELHSYREGSANTFIFTAPARHEDACYLTEGNKLSFFYNNRGYYFNIVKSVRTEYTVEVTAYALMFELLNSELGEYKASHAMTFAEYMGAFDTNGVVELGINEVHENSVTNEWTGTSTLLARIFSLANVFHAEVEFIPELNRDYSLRRLVLNVYKENDGECQGVGRRRNDITLRYGLNVKGITKTADITGLRTAIRPIGTDGLTITGLDKSEYDADGRLEFSSPIGYGCIYAIQSRNQFPSNLLNKGSDGYILEEWRYDTDNVNMLYGQALAELKKNCVPQVSYEVDGYFDTDIGDTVTIVDEEFSPELYLEARVTEQVRSFTDPVRNKTVFDNYVEMQYQIDTSLIEKMNELIKASKMYSCMISTDNGILFRNGKGSTTLTANVRNTETDITDLFIIQWKKDGSLVGTGRKVTVYAEDVPEKAVYKFEAWDSDYILRGSYEVTVSSVFDGTNGTDGKNGENGVGIAFVTNKYAISHSNEIAPSVWMDSVPTMTIVDRYLWNYEVITYTDATIYETEKRVIGVYGNTGPEGPATGVTVSENEPVGKYAGMLWKHTGAVPGLIRNAVYRWNGSIWEIFMFIADNIDVNSIFAKEILATGTVKGLKLIGTEAYLTNGLYMKYAAGDQTGHDSEYGKAAYYGYAHDATALILGETDIYTLILRCSGNVEIDAEDLVLMCRNGNEIRLSELHNRVAVLDSKIHKSGCVMVSFGSLPNNTKKSVSANIPASAVQWWIESGWATSPNGTVVYPLPYIDVNNFANGVQVVINASKQIEVTTKSNWSGYPAYFLVAWK